MARRDWYWCGRCEVLGLGEQCWCCHSTVLRRRHAELDALEAWLNRLSPEGAHA